MSSTYLTTLVGKNVVVTGKFTNHTQNSAEAVLRTAGALIQKAVTKTTDVLVVGVDFGATKTDKARSLGVPSISWAEAESLMAATPAGVQTTEPPVGIPRGGEIAIEGYREVDPMLCKLSAGLPSAIDERWVYEVKWDGRRCIAHIDPHGNVALVSRQGNDQTARFGHIAAELSPLTDSILDGELVALDESGRSDVHALAGDGTATFVAYDVLRQAGLDMRKLPLSQRRETLETMLQTYGPFTFTTLSPWFDDGESLLEYALEHELEGIVAKMRASTYAEGKRPDTWLKIKLRMEQEFAVIGSTKGQGNRANTAGSFLLGVNTGNAAFPNEYEYCGSVGSGGTVADFDAIYKQLTTPAVGELSIVDLRTRFTNAELREITFARPEVVLQVRFQKWTNDGKLWHPSISHQRTDKAPRDVRKETTT